MRTGSVDGPPPAPTGAIPASAHSASTGLKPLPRQCTADVPSRGFASDTNRSPRAQQLDVEQAAPAARRGPGREPADEVLCLRVLDGVGDDREAPRGAHAEPQAHPGHLPVAADREVGRDLLRPFQEGLPHARLALSRDEPLEVGRSAGHQDPAPAPAVPGLPDERQEPGAPADRRGKRREHGEAGPGQGGVERRLVAQAGEQGRVAHGDARPVRLEALARPGEGLELVVRRRQDEADRLGAAGLAQGVGEGVAAATGGRRRRRSANGAVAPSRGCRRPRCGTSRPPPGAGRRRAPGIRPPRGRGPREGPGSPGGFQVDRVGDLRVVGTDARRTPRGRARRGPAARAATS